MQNALFHCLNVWFGNMDHIKGFKLSVKYFNCDYLRIEKSGDCIGHKLGFFFSDPSFKTTVKHLEFRQPLCKCKPFIFRACFFQRQSCTPSLKATQCSISRLEILDVFFMLLAFMKTMNCVFTQELMVNSDFCEMLLKMHQMATEF